MRVTKQVMAGNNAKIVDEAARLFREKGIEATSVADVMGAAGLTHGGFYRHFSSKDELVSAAINKASDDMASDLENDVLQHGAKQAIADFVRGYLSEQHVANPGKGCPIAALGAEVDRESKVHKKEIAYGAERLVSILVQGFAGNLDEKQAKAIGLLAVLVGTLVLARSAKTKRTMNEILTSGYRLAEFCIGRVEKS